MAIQAKFLRWRGHFRLSPYNNRAEKRFISHFHLKTSGMMSPTRRQPLVTRRLLRNAEPDCKGARISRVRRLIRRRPSRSVQYSFDESCSYTGINHQISVLHIGLSIGSVSKVFKEEIFLEPSKLN